MPHQRKHFVLVTIHVLSGMTKVISNDGQKHNHANEDNEQNVEIERERTEEGRRTTQFVHVELHQDHLEHHLDSTEDSRTFGQLESEG